MEDQAFEDLYTRSTAGPPSDRWLSLVRGVGTNPVLEPSSPPHSSAAAVPAESAALDYGCVFLDPFGQCSIYDVRPVQCRTYPFWPSLLESKEDWDNEAVLPDDAPLERSSASPESGLGGISSDNGSSSNSSGYSAAAAANRYWSLEEGGCEGIGVATADCVGEAEIERKRQLALRHWRRFPDEEIKETTWYL